MHKDDLLTLILIFIFNLLKISANKLVFFLPLPTNPSLNALNYGIIYVYGIYYNST